MTRIHLAVTVGMFMSVGFGTSCDIPDAQTDVNQTDTSLDSLTDVGSAVELDTSTLPVGSASTNDITDTGTDTNDNYPNTNPTDETAATQDESDCVSSTIVDTTSSGTGESQTDVDTDTGSEAVVADEVNVLADEVAAEAAVEEDRLALPAEGNETLLELEEGDVLVSSEGEGFLRKVVSVTQEDGSIIIETVPATLEDVFDELVVAYDILAEEGPSGFMPAPPETPPSSRGLMDADLAGLVLFDGYVGGAPLFVTVHEGALSFDPELASELEIHGASLNKLRFSVRSSLTASLALRAEAGGVMEHSGETEVLLGETRTVKRTGKVDLVHTVRWYAELGYELRATGPGTVEAGLAVAGDVDAALAHSAGGWSPPKDQDFALEAIGPAEIPVAAAYLAGTLRVRVEVDLYGEAGPHFELGPYFAFDSTVGAPCAWSLIGGVQGTVGVHPGATSKSFVAHEAKLRGSELELGRGTCDTDSVTEQPTTDEPPTDPTDPSTDFTTDSLSIETTTESSTSSISSTESLTEQPTTESVTQEPSTEPQTETDTDSSTDTGTPPDPCASLPCDHGLCVPDAAETFLCECEPGYMGALCEVDINECGAVPCQNGGACRDLVNGFACDCLAGFDGATCAENIDDCVGGPCQNGGTCVDRVAGFTCSCPQGYSGEFCEVNVDDCADAPCQNGGTCNDDVGGYTCSCPVGFDGANCDVNIDDCATDPCLNGAACIDGVNSYTCTCQSGFEGSNCHINIDDCAPDPCLNGGACHDGVNSYTCSCAAGYSGTNCETNIDDCGGAPCLNGGTCVDGVASYSCQCPAGFDGSNCHINIDDCSPNPCQNGGTCVDGIASYSCECPAGFDGSNCHINIDDCQGSPCQNGGTCHDGVNSYSCSCAAGYSGLTCETNIDDCASDPCLNGGTCMDGIASFSCECPAGFEGSNCHINIDDCSPNPCLNGGTCEDGVASYTCQCPAGYSGTNCQMGIGIAWVTLPAGSFWMGTPDGNCPADYPGGAACASQLSPYGNEDLHYVTLTHDFELMRTEVTQTQFAALMGYNPSSFKSCGGTCPVETVNWYEALAFANALSGQAGYAACYDCTGTGPSVTCGLKAAYAKPQDCPGYRLPTESEWEYAARAGTLTALYNGALTNTSCSPLDPNLDAIGWYCGNSDSATSRVGCNSEYTGGTTCGSQPVAGKTPNAWGLYDMSGNVLEWTWDWYDETYPAGTTSAPIVDPVGPASATNRVLRGGGWLYRASVARSGVRFRDPPGARAGNFGFRLALTVPDLSGLVLSAGAISPDFNASTNTYTLSVANYVTATTVTANLSDSGASLTINGETGTSGVASASIPLAVGDTTITILVTAKNGTTTKSYAVTVTRAIHESEWSRIPAGSFWMGTPDGSCPADYPGGTDCAYELGRWETGTEGYRKEDLHYVTLTHDFELMRTEVTQAQFAALMSYNPSWFKSCGTSCPVGDVNWYEALAFANALSGQAGYAACYDCTGTGSSVTCGLKAAYTKPQDCPGYRLPTESEWEYAARAGTLTAFYNGAITNTGCSPLDSNLDAIGWYCGNAGGTTHPVGQKIANAWGLYDMSGNVHEWTWDWMYYYPAGTTSAPVVDPVGFASGQGRVVRSSLWPGDAEGARSGYRNGMIPSGRGSFLGFRLARSVP
jgi:Notch-like protein